MIEWCVVMGGGKVVMVPGRFFCVPGAGVVVMGGVSVVMVPGKERSMTSQKQIKGVWSQKGPYSRNFSCDFAHSTVS